MDKSKDLYRRLGFEIVKDDGEYVGMKFPGDKTLLSLNAYKEYWASRGKSACVYVVENLNHTYQDWSAVVKENVSELKKADWGEYFSFRDFDGNIIEVMKG